LRTIDSFAELLKSESESSLNEDCLDYLDRIQHGAQKMSTFIDNLLNYSKTISSAHKLEPVDMNAVVKEILEDLNFQLKKVNAKVTVAELPIVNASPLLMNQLISNLLGNAIKYAGQEPLQIDITAKSEEGFWVFSVRDNGIGIDPNDAKRIFDLFQRVGEAGRPGTGIGLTLCKKIIEEYGGRIWVDSEPGKGSTFYFTLPAQ
jgi:signal transduction histidine kinase